jgi:CRP/FNR family cyclic AMP-dependent transcriptional regulator
VSVEPVKGTFLALLPAEERVRVLGLGWAQKFPAGATMMYEGEPGERVMILSSGRAKVTRVLEGGHETLLSIRDPGDVVGELAFIDGQPRIASVSALDPVEAQIIGSSAFRAHLERSSRAAMSLLEVVVRRLRETTVKRSQFAASDTVGRLSARLIELADRYGDRTEDGIAITLALSQEELAAWTGASRAGVAQALHTLRELGWIATSRRRLLIRDLDALRRRAA